MLLANSDVGGSEMAEKCLCGHWRDEHEFGGDSCQVCAADACPKFHHNSFGSPSAELADLQAALQQAQEERDKWKGENIATLLNMAQVVGERDAAFERAEIAEAKLVLADIDLQEALRDAQAQRALAERLRKLVLSLRWQPYGMATGDGDQCAACKTWRWMPHAKGCALVLLALTPAEALGGQEEGD